MIFRRSFLSELANSASAVFIALLTIVLTIALVRFLGQAANGDVANEAVVALITFAALNNLAVLLQLTVFIAVLLVLTRMWRDGEMVVWLSSGVGLSRWVKPILMFALPVMLVVAMFSLLVAPWASRQASEFKARFEQRNDVSRVAPGQFRESADGSRVFFVEGLSDDLAHVRNVFVASLVHGKLGVMVSQSGRMEMQANGDQFLVLENGRRYEGTAGMPDYKIVNFDQYGVRTEAALPNFAADASTRVKSTWELITDRSANNLGELVWRLGLPLSVLSLALLALPLSFVNPRAGRSANLIMALLVYFTYSNALTIIQNWTARGNLPFALTWWILHVAVLGLAAVLLWWRVHLHRSMGAFAVALFRPARVPPLTDEGSARP